MFSLDPAFLTTSDALTTLDLCEVRLQSDSRFPWLILVPQVADVRELDDLAPEARLAFVDEILRAGVAVRAMGAVMGRPVDKLNIGLLGNITPQLHAHVVGRRPDDAAWPGPVWGQGVPRPYPVNEGKAVVAAALGVLQRL